MKKSLFLIFTFLSLHIYAQFVEAEQCIGGNGDEVIKDIKPTPDGGVMVIAETNSGNRDFEDNHGSQDIALIKLNANREVEWKKCFGDSLLDIYVNFIAGDSAYYLLSADIDSISYFNNGIRREIRCISLSGEEKWVKTCTSYLWEMYQYIYDDPGRTFMIPLKNNTLLYFDSRITDTTIEVHNIDRQGNELWERDFNYDFVFEGKTLDLGTPEIEFENTVYELEDSTFILRNYCVNYCSFGICANTGNTEFVHMNYDGSIIDRKNADAYDLVPSSSKLIKEDANNLYFYYDSYYARLIYRLDKNLFEVNLTDTIHYNLLKPTRERVQDFNLRSSNEYLSFDTESSANTNTYSFSKVNVDTRNVRFTTLLDTASAARAISLVELFYLDDDNSNLVIYLQDSMYYIMRIDSNGTIAYRKLFSDSIQRDEHFDFPNRDNMPNKPSDVFFRGLSNIQDGKLYTYFFYNNNVHQTQRVLIHDIKTGNEDFEYTNNMPDNTLIEYVSPMREHDNQIFVLADLDGRNSCRLGGFDIQLKDVRTNSNNIYGAAYIDYNNNYRYDGNDVLYNLSMLKSTKGNNTVSTFMYGNLYTKNYVDTGTWATKLIPFHNYFTMTPTLQFTSHADFNHSDTVIFALRPVADIHDLSINLVNTFVTRLGNSTNYEITYANYGTYAADGDVKLVIDNRLSVQSKTPVFTEQNGDTLVWHFSNLKANEFRKISITVLADIPPVLNMGDEISSTAWVSGAYSDSFPGDNQSVLKETIRGSYDPNDKVSTNGDDMTTTQIQNGDYITYVVRFQNTGNDTAYKVVILDTLSSNVTSNSFQMVDASHNFSVQMLNNHILQFTSNNIVLPPASVNENASHGFVAYKVKPASSLNVGDTIKNTAQIYFDYNPPVSTSTVNTRITLLTSIHPDIKNDLLKLYPNPNNGIFNIEFNGDYSSALTLSILNIEGRDVFEQQVPHAYKTVIQVNAERFASGIYTILLKTDKEQQSQKIMIVK